MTTAAEVSVDDKEGCGCTVTLETEFNDGVQFSVCVIGGIPCILSLGLAVSASDIVICRHCKKFESITEQRQEDKS